MPERLSDKREFYLLDCFRLICAIGVVAVHLRPFMDIDKNADLMITLLLTRLCVPFFFLAAGFFLERSLDDRKKMKSYIMGLLRMYLVYSAIYLPQVIYDYAKRDTGLLLIIASFIRRFLLLGTYTHLWFILGLIVAALLLYIAKICLRLPDRALMAAAIVLYIIGVLGNAYVEQTAAHNGSRVIAAYYGVFVTTRNGLFLGFPFVFTGYYIGRHRQDIKRKNFFLIGLAFHVAIAVESYIYIYIYAGKRRGDGALFLSGADCDLLFSGYMLHCHA